MLKVTGYSWGGVWDFYFFDDCNDLFLISVLCFMWVFFFFSTLGMHSLWKNKGVQRKIPLQPGGAVVTVERSCGRGLSQPLALGGRKIQCNEGKERGRRDSRSLSGPPGPLPVTQPPNLCLLRQLAPLIVLVPDGASGRCGLLWQL